MTRPRALRRPALIARLALLAAALTTLSAALPAAAHAAAPITGSWMTEEGDAIITIANFSTMKPATMPITAGRFVTIMPTSRNMPTVTKNRPSRTSRKGLMSSST